LGCRTATANQQDIAPIELAGEPEVRGVPSTIHSIHENAPLSGISMDNEEWMEELFEESYLRVGQTWSMEHSTHGQDTESLTTCPPIAVEHRLLCHSKGNAVSPRHSEFERSSDRACSQEIPQASAAAAVGKKSDREKLNLKKPSLDTVVAFLISPEWEDHQRILTDWRTFVDIRRPIRATSKECAYAVSDMTSARDQRDARTPKDFPTPSSQSHSMSMYPIYETAIPECDELSIDQPALDPREVVRRKKILQRVHPIGTKDLNLKLRKGNNEN
jgi:hypothetical protein